MDRPPGFVGHSEAFHHCPLKRPPKRIGKHADFIAIIEWASSPWNSSREEYYISRRSGFWLLWLRVEDDNAWTPRWYWNFVAWALDSGIDVAAAANFLLLDYWSVQREREGLKPFDLIDDDGVLSPAAIWSIAGEVWGNSRATCPCLHCRQFEPTAVPLPSMSKPAAPRTQDAFIRTSADAEDPGEELPLSKDLRWLKTIAGPASLAVTLTEAPIPEALFGTFRAHPSMPYGSTLMLDAAAANRRLKDCRPGAWLISPKTGWKWAVFANTKVDWVPSSVVLPEYLQVSDGTSDEPVGAQHTASTPLAPSRKIQTQLSQRSNLQRRPSSKTVTGKSSSTKRQKSFYLGSIETGYFLSRSSASHRVQKGNSEGSWEMFVSGPDFPNGEEHVGTYDAFELRLAVDELGYEVSQDEWDRMGIEAVPDGAETPISATHVKESDRSARHARVRVSVVWSDGETRSITLTKRDWERVLAGIALKKRGSGYRADGGFFWDHWAFEGGIEGRLTVTYSGEGVGFDGKLDDAEISTEDPQFR